MKESVIWENKNGDTIEFGRTFPYAITRRTGFDTVNAFPLLEPGFNQNGAYYYQTLEDVRVLNMRIAYNFNTIEEKKQKRKEILNILNPLLGLGTITYEDDAGKYIIDALVSYKPAFHKIQDGRTAMAEYFDVIFTCPKPDWLSFEAITGTIDGLIGGMTIPLTIPLKIPEISAGTTIIYDGDNPADITFDISVESGGGTAENPKITNQDGDYIEIDYLLTEGERIVVDTNPDAPTIVLIDSEGNQTDGWEYLIWGSTFFQIQNGTNSINVTASTGGFSVDYSLRKHYSGV